MQQCLEVFFKCVFVAMIVIMTIIGGIATLGTMQGGLANFLSLIPNADPFAVKISSSIIAYGLMGAARLPWILSSACSILSAFGEEVGKKCYQIGRGVGYKLGLSPQLEAQPVQKQQENCSWDVMGVSLLKISAAAIHGFCFGALARSGGGHVLSDLMTTLNVPLDAASMVEVGEMSALVTQGTVQAAISAHAFFGQNSRNQRAIDVRNHNAIFNAGNDPYAPVTMPANP